MKKFFLTLSLLLLLPSFLLAATPPKSELGLIGELIATESGPNLWTFNADFLFPITKGGSFLLGPAVAVGSEDELTRLGAGFDWNLTGPKIGPFIGASAFHFVKDIDDADTYTITARAGFKFPIGKGAAIKVYAWDVLDGRGKDSTDISVAAGIVARF